MMSDNRRWQTEIDAKTSESLMHLYEVRTNEEAVDVLSAYIVTGCSIGLEGRRRMRSFDKSTWAGRRNRRRLNRVLGQCLEWYREDRCDAEDGPLVGPHEAVYSAVSQHITSTLYGWVLSIVAGWIIELAVDAFVRWILSEESDRYRGATNERLDHTDDCNTQRGARSREAWRDHVLPRRRVH